MTDFFQDIQPLMFILSWLFFWIYWTQVTYSFYMLKGWWRAINSLKKWENISTCWSLLCELILTMWFKILRKTSLLYYRIFFKGISSHFKIGILHFLGNAFSWCIKNHNVRRISYYFHKPSLQGVSTNLKFGTRNFS